MVDGEKIKDIMLAVDAGYNINEVAMGYVEQFNKVSHFMILDWSVRNPTDEEVKHAQEFQALNVVDKVFKAGDEWFTSVKTFDGTGEVKKRVFVLLVNRYQKVPQHLYESRMEALGVTPIDRKFIDAVGPTTVDGKGKND